MAEELKMLFFEAGCLFSSRKEDSTVWVLETFWLVVSNIFLFSPLFGEDFPI